MSDCSLYDDGKELPLGDGKIRLCRIKTRDKEHIRVYRKQSQSKEQILCMVSGMEGGEFYRAAAIRWLREYARAEFEKKVRFYADKMQVSVNRIAVKEQKTRWGSCSAKGTLSFNWRLMLAPPAILDYVVVHELCHLTHMNHSAAFWQAVEAVYPDYRSARRWLKEHGQELIL